MLSIRSYVNNYGFPDILENHSFTPNKNDFFINQLNKYKNGRKDC